MKYTGFKLININVSSTGRYYLPDDQFLRDKKINAIVSFPNSYSVIHPPLAEFINPANIYINLTKNGQTYFYHKSLDLISNIYSEGVFDELNTQLSLADCYIEVLEFSESEGYVGFNVQLGVFFENNNISNHICSSKSGFENIETYIDNAALLSIESNRFYFKDNRFLSNKKLKSIYIDNTTIMPDGSTCINSDIMNAAFISLVSGNEFIWEKMPLLLLYQLYNIKKISFANLNCDLINSYIQVSFAWLRTESNISGNILLNVEYAIEED